MKKLSIFLLLLALCMVAYPQKAKKNAEPTPTDRKVSTFFANALRNYYTGNYEAAERSFRDALAANPSHDATFFMLGRMKADVENYAEAEENLSKACQRWITKGNIPNR